MSTVVGVCERTDFATDAFARVNVLPRPNSLDGTDITPPAGTLWNGGFRCLISASRVDAVDGPAAGVGDGVGCGPPLFP